MTYQEITRLAEEFYPAIILDGIVRFKIRRRAEKILETLAVMLFTFSAIGFIFSRVYFNAGPFKLFAAKVAGLEPKFLGGFFLCLALWIVIYSINAFYQSYYFKNAKTILPERGIDPGNPAITFEAASIVASFRNSDPAAGFCRSIYGRAVLTRLGVGVKQTDGFINKKSPLSLAPDSFSVLPKRKDGFVGMGDVASAIFSLDEKFAQFLAMFKVNQKEFVGAAEWVERMYREGRNEERWWGRDRLGRVPGIGKEWSFGGVYILRRYAVDITAGRVNFLTEKSSSVISAVGEVEAILSRSKEANALLVGEESMAPMGVVEELGKKISNGSILPPLEYKRVFLFDSEAFIAAMKTKADFETEFLRLLDEAARAGNIILTFNDFQNFIKNAETIGSNALSLMEPYLASPMVQVIAIVESGVFHQDLEHNGKLMRQFEKVLVKPEGEEATLEIVEDEALAVEAQEKIFFTFPAVLAVIESADRYFADGIMPDKAVKLLLEIAPQMKKSKISFVVRDDVVNFVAVKTGIPGGAVGQEEREKLLNLEGLLHERIVGQEEAVKAIANAMRRARSDIENPNRPMGSFLFLGPTGVGKTETTKALAKVFFGNDGAIIRFDMSEYRTDDALKRLIGSFEDGKVGVLSAKLREQPYGVLLLDEFEKTNKEVLDLFLQVLDEGFFSDMAGRRVNARNLIIIATSNAGSDLIWNLVKEGKELASQKAAVVNAIINQGIFKPELLNRFDGVVLFNPLSAEQLRKIAMLMLGNLQKRLSEKGIKLVINAPLIDTIVAAGTDPAFGARPMNRAIQEKVEQVIAEKMIAGTIKPGSMLELGSEELK